MGQIPYTLRFKTGKANRSGECLVYIRYYSCDQDLMIPTSVRVPKTHFLPGKTRNPIAKSNPNHAELNLNLDNLRRVIENRLANYHGEISLAFILGQTASNDRIVDFIDTLISEKKGKLSEGTLRHYVVMRNKVKDYDHGATFRSINLAWLQGLEKYIRDKVGSGNTVNSNMKKIKAILNNAVDLDLLERKQIDRYTNPAYVEDLPVYLVESEIEAFYKITKAAAPGPSQVSGYYFLLGCYTGYRISDLISFNYLDKVKDNNTIVLRAKKNKNIVSIPIFPRLAEILAFCKDNPLNVVEKEMRLNVKAIAKLAGIKSDVKIHSARHSFAMLLLEKGLTIDEVAELLGDSRDVAKRYARIINKQLHRRVMDVMK